jgi:hypothetical protein
MPEQYGLRHLPNKFFQPLQPIKNGLTKLSGALMLPFFRDYAGETSVIHAIRSLP